MLEGALGYFGLTGVRITTEFSVVSSTLSAKHLMDGTDRDKMVSNARIVFMFERGLLTWAKLGVQIDMTKKYNQIKLVNVIGMFLFNR